MSRLTIVVIVPPDFDPEPLINWVRDQIERAVGCTDCQINRGWNGSFTKLLRSDEAWVVTDYREPYCIKSRTRPFARPDLAARPSLAAALV